MIDVAMQKTVKVRMLRGLLDFIILYLLHRAPMHGYQIIISIRQKFGVYFGPSTIYPILFLLEKRGAVKSAWDTSHERPRKVYTITYDGEELLRFAELSLAKISQKINGNADVTLMERLCEKVWFQKAYSFLCTRRFANAPLTEVTANVARVS